MYNAENIKKLDTNMPYVYTYSKRHCKKGKKEEPDVQSRFKERNSKKEQKGSYREMLDNVFELRRRIYMFWRVIIVLPFAVLVKTTTICIFHGHILILYNFFLKRQWFLLKGIKCFSYVHVML